MASEGELNPILSHIQLPYDRLLDQVSIGWNHKSICLVVGTLTITGDPIEQLGASSACHYSPSE